MDKSNRKGASAELEIRDLLRPWWQQVEPEVVMVRTPASGGWHASATFRTAGDLMVTPGSKWPWSVEIKRRESWSPKGFVAGRRSPVWSWWAQATQDALKIDAQPMLWVRRSNGNWIVLVPRRQVVTIAGAPPPRFNWSDTVVVGERGATLVPVGYWGDEFLASDPHIWLP